LLLILIIETTTNMPLLVCTKKGGESQVGVTELQN